MTKQDLQPIVGGSWARVHLNPLNYNSNECISSSTRSSSNPSTGKRLWHEIWSIPMATKIRNFIWRACSKILPTKATLHQRHILPEPECDLCHGHGEFATHALWNCKSARAIWQHCSLPLGCLSHIQDHGSFMDVVDIVIHNLSREEVSLFCTISWKIWYRRNEIHLHGIWKDQSLVYRQATNFFKEFTRCQKARRCGSQAPKMPISRTHQTPPMDGFYKVTMALCCLSSPCKAGSGILVRDHGGNVIAICAAFRYHILTTKIRRS